MDLERNSNNQENQNDPITAGSLFPSAGSGAKADLASPGEGGDDAGKKFKAPLEFSVQYVLTKEELLSALREARVFKSSAKGKTVRTVLLLIVLSITIYNMSIDNNYLGMGIFMTTLCILLIAAVWLIPEISLTGRAKRSADGVPMRVDFFADRLEITKENQGEENHATVISLDGSYRIVRENGIYTIFLENRRIFVVPERIIPLERRTFVRILLSGKGAAEADQE